MTIREKAASIFALKSTLRSIRYDFQSFIHPTEEEAAALFRTPIVLRTRRDGDEGIICGTLNISHSSDCLLEIRRTSHLQILIWRARTSSKVFWHCLRWEHYRRARYPDSPFDISPCACNSNSINVVDSAAAQTIDESYYSEPENTGKILTCTVQCIQQLHFEKNQRLHSYH